MDSQDAAENLQTIRTLMERSALYRRALAPIMLFAGAVGVAAAVAGIAFRIEELHGFCQLWMAIAALVLIGAFLITRRQAIRDHEPFWSPPARRITVAIFPPLALGACLGFGMLRLANDEVPQLLMVPALWIALYGCALHTGGHFATGGLRQFAWLFILPGCAALPWFIYPRGVVPWQTAHVVMGAWFGALHLAYGAYLYATKRNGQTT
ncbi:MAG: hypothetical protein HY301_20805 [Verrucomicrobia bacterium]|nr:hypothetical protein [Verrucomicrobiota bacterium]